MTEKRMIQEKLIFKTSHILSLRKISYLFISLASTLFLGALIINTGIKLFKINIISVITLAMMFISLLISIMGYKNLKREEVIIEDFRNIEKFEYSREFGLVSTRQLTSVYVRAAIFIGIIILDVSIIIRQLIRILNLY